VLSQRVAGVLPAAIDKDHVRLSMSAATAEVNFYPFEPDESPATGQEIVEYRIVRKDGETTFFLHFLLDDLARAQELFGQMREALVEEAARKTTHVLLSCTSALTTSLFAQKMNDVATTLTLDYDFRAMSVDKALVTSEPFAVILLAPQVAHMRKQMMDAHPDALVFEIPAKIFGSYDAAGAVRLLLHALREASEPPETSNDLRAVRRMHDNRRVLAITLFSLRDHVRLGYRLYDKGDAMAEGTVRKPKLDYRDIEDLVQVVLAREVDVTSLDAIGIAVPGVAFRGKVSLPGIVEGDFDLGVALSERFGLPVYVDNNCNAAAVGCYVSQDECDNLLFYRHAFGHIAGGMGTVIDGKLLKGHGNLAGEPKYFEPYFAYDVPYTDLYWSAEGMNQLALSMAVTSAAIVAPDAIYLAVDTVDDAEAMHLALVRILGERNAPQVHVVTDYVERVYLGVWAMALQKLNDPKYRSLGVRM
jgi:cellobiose-specific phosphotransferase system component IIB